VSADRPQPVPRQAERSALVRSTVDPAGRDRKVPRGFTLLLALLACLLIAPTPGDVGGCGQEPRVLDAPIFFATKNQIDCEACSDCGFDTQTCFKACATRDTRGQRFPEGCVPLVHDGEVCLRALAHTSCDDYSRFVSDQGAEVPSECNFCPPRRP